MSSFEPTTDNLPVVVPETQPEVLPKQESSDALLRRTVCTSPMRTRAFDQLIDMHTYMRPAFSKVDRKFIHTFIKPTGAVPDKFGNYYLAVGETAPIMWSSHTDTVHHKKGFQIVGFDKMEIGLAAENKNGSNCLGADDTAGVWLMLQMIKAKVPGLYVFHRAEEGGRKGSQFIAKEHGDLLSKVKYCIALDRREKTSVITHQSSRRTCSDEFGKSMIEQLDMGYVLDTTGSYTDSYSYVDVIAECTNISVGYTGAHTDSERLDVEFIFKLRDKLVKFDWEKLVCERDPAKKEYKTYHYEGGSYNHRSYGNFGSGTFADEWGLGDDDDWVQNEHGTYVRRESLFLSGTKSGTQVGVGCPGTQDKKLGETMNGTATHKYVNGKPIEIATAKAKEKEEDDEDDLDKEVDLRVYTRLIERNAEAVAEILIQMGVTYADLQNEVMETYGVVNC